MFKLPSRKMLDIGMATGVIAEVDGVHHHYHLGNTQHPLDLA